MNRMILLILGILFITGCSSYITEEEAISIGNAFLLEEYKHVERIFDNWETDLSAFDYEFETSHATFSEEKEAWYVYINIIGLAKIDLCVDDPDNPEGIIETCYLNKGKNYITIMTDQGEQKLGEYKKLATIEIDALTGEVLTDYGDSSESRIT